MKITYTRITSIKIFFFKILRVCKKKICKLHVLQKKLFGIFLKKFLKKKVIWGDN